MSSEAAGGGNVTPALACEGVVVGFGAAPVLAGVDLVVGPAEVVALLGPSGSGKTTLLSAVAGFLRITGGEIRVAGAVVADRTHHVPPERRGVAVVFQGHALWPHLSALETVAYPLRRRGVEATEARRIARTILDRLGIGALAGRRPAELSGGEQQRVGLGRALARDAGLYLFDEPTAHLDASLRIRLQEQIAEQRRATGAAAVYATHDTAEALAIADRVALLRGGRLVQVAGPREVYERPVDLWAAMLTGPASLIRVCVLERGGERAWIEVAGRRASVLLDGPGSEHALVRPDWATLGGPLPGVIADMAYRGTHTDYELDTPAGTLGVREPGPPRVSRGDATGWRLDRAWLLDRGDADPSP